MGLVLDLAARSAAVGSPPQCIVGYKITKIIWVAQVAVCFEGFAGCVRPSTHSSLTTPSGFCEGMSFVFISGLLFLCRVATRPIHARSGGGRKERASEARRQN